MNQLPLKDRLLAYRKAKHLTLEAFAPIIGVSVQTLWRWEAGRTKPQGLQKKRIESILAKAGL